MPRVSWQELLVSADLNDADVKEMHSAYFCIDPTDGILVPTVEAESLVEIGRIAECGQNADACLEVRLALRRMAFFPEAFGLTMKHLHLILQS